MQETQTAASIRKFLLATLAIGTIGTGIELLLIEHFETVSQQVPLIVLLLGGPTFLWHTLAPRPITVRALQATMVLLVISGMAGIALHLRGNVEFELEITPSMGGMELFRKTITGATPVLAPGSMTLLGLIGLTHSYRHPSLDTDASAPRNGEGE
jgi:hypothetical protein